jgi:hypothetical protein
MILLQLFISPNGGPTGNFRIFIYTLQLKIEQTAFYFTILSEVEHLDAKIVVELLSMSLKSSRACRACA